MPTRTKRVEIVNQENRRIPGRTSRLLSIGRVASKAEQPQ